MRVLNLVVHYIIARRPPRRWPECLTLISGLPQTPSAKDVGRHQVIWAPQKTLIFRILGTISSL